MVSLQGFVGPDQPISHGRRCCDCCEVQTRKTFLTQHLAIVTHLFIRITDSAQRHPLLLHWGMPWLEKKFQLPY